MDHITHILNALRGNAPATPEQHAHDYIRSMNTLANGGSFGGFKSAGQYGAENAQNAADSIRKQGPYAPMGQ